jgi:uncharacterized protein (TIGR03083 family)
MADVRATVRQEREALAADVGLIHETAWATPSLCPGWTVRDVLAHMTALARMTPPMFFQKLVVSGFNPSKLQSRDITVEKGISVDETLSRFRSVTDSKNRLRAVPKKTALGETLLHAEDIRRPLGIDHDYPLGALVIVADAYKGSNLVAGTKRRIAGLSLQATDIGWSTGSGPLVSGPMLSLLMAMAGRLSAAVGDLEGDGVEALRSRADP